MGGEYGPLRRRDSGRPCRSRALPVNPSFFVSLRSSHLWRGLIAHERHRESSAKRTPATGCDVAQERMSELERDMQPLAEEIIAAPATSLGGLRAKALVALWEALPKSASHHGAFDFPDASRSLFEAVAGMTGLLPLVRELEARLEADAESKDVDT
jgi:hypothetical protein